MNIDADPKIIVALDFDSQQKALNFTQQLDPLLCRVKVGKELFTHAGPALVDKLTARGFSVFLDLKFHDIPNTVAKACKAVATLGVWMINVHALGGKKMLQAAREALLEYQNPPLLIGVTILTSMQQNDLQDVGLSGTPAENVLRLAALSEQCGLDGVVCSPLEVPVLRDHCGPDFTLVTPGVRPAGASQDDQQRVLTPREAIKAGSSYLVIGRPITQASQPLEALTAIARDMVLDA